MPISPSDVAFAHAVKAIHVRKGSRATYACMGERGVWQTAITPNLAAFMAAKTSVFLATVSAEGQPYIQHHGGPPGFLHVLDTDMIGFADFAGNRQYITQGNLTERSKAHLFLIDYAHRRHVKIWGEARLIEDDDALTARLMPPDYNAKPERAVLFTVTAWDANCPQHIPQRFEATDLASALEARDRRIAELEAEVALLSDI